MAEGFPGGQDGGVDRSIAERARQLLHDDRFLDDEIFTPPPAIGMNIDPGEGNESGDRASVNPAPQAPAGSEALAEPTT